MVKLLVPVKSKPAPVSVRVLAPSERDWLAAGFSILSVLVVREPVRAALAVMRELLVSVPAPVANAE